MRFHVVGLPHTKVTKEFGSCAFTQKVRKFCDMMSGQGHEVYLYGAGDATEARCNEFISCLPEDVRAAVVSKVKHYTEPSWDATLPHWRMFNLNAAANILARLQPKDFVCVIGGICHKPIADLLPEAMVVEFGIGYHSTFAKYRVWESYSHMHAVYAADAGTPNIDGIWFDEVIPNSFESDDFPFSEEKDDYLLFLGRLIDRKGIGIAVDVAKITGKRLIVAGPGKPPKGVEYAGVADAKLRGELMSKAYAVLVPTVYLEPFGGVAVESMLCGTPVITTDWGAFTETVIQGKTGYRCRTLKQFVEAVDAVGGLSHRDIREHALQYDTALIAPRYEAYFDRLLTLHGKGWTELGSP